MEDIIGNTIFSTPLLSEQVANLEKDYVRLREELKTAQRRYEAAMRLLDKLQYKLPDEDAMTAEDVYFEVEKEAGFLPSDQYSTSGEF